MVISTGERKAEDNTRAWILLKADDGLTDSAISEHVGCHWKTAYNTCKSYAQRGLAAMNRREPDREYTPKRDGEAEAHLIRLACSEPPEGHSRWTLHLLAENS